MTDTCLASIIGPVVTSGVLIGGWFFVRKDNNQRELRKELRIQLDAAAADVERIVELAERIYTVRGDDPAAEGYKEKLLSSLKVLGARTHVISRTYPRFSVSTQIVALRQATTGSASGFDDPDRSPGAEARNTLQTVVRAGAALTVALETQYYALFAS